MYRQDSVEPVDSRGFSSIEGTNHLCSQLPALFNKHNIVTMFDAGSNDCAWQMQTLAKMLRYSAGEHNPIMVELAKASNPDLDIVVHDIRKDSLPDVDVLFLRDVAIHLNNNDKQQMIRNWLRSDIPWILMTQVDIIIEAEGVLFKNKDFEYNDFEFPFAEVNWKLPPWNFPEPTDFVTDLWPKSRRYMALWHRSQICL